MRLVLQPGGCGFVAAQEARFQPVPLQVEEEKRGLKGHSQPSSASQGLDCGQKIVSVEGGLRLVPVDEVEVIRHFGQHDQRLHDRIGLESPQQRGKAVVPGQRKVRRQRHGLQRLLPGLLCAEIGCNPDDPGQK